MPLERLSSNPNFEVVEEISNIPKMYGTPVTMTTNGTKVVRSSVVHLSTGMYMAGNLNLVENGGKDDIRFYKTGCLIRKTQDNLDKKDRFKELTFIDNDGNILFILQDLDTMIPSKYNGKFLLSFTEQGVKITKKLLKGGELSAELTYDQLSLGDSNLIFDNENFYEAAKTGAQLGE